jgi:Glycosyl hydrolase catalytic core
MKKFSICVVASVVFGCLAIRSTFAADAIVGVNVMDIKNSKITEAQQDALIEQLQHNGVTTIRTGMLNSGMLDPKFAHFIIGAYQHGIQTILLIYPKQGGSDKHLAPANTAVGRPWGAPALSDADPDGFRNWLGPQLAVLEAARVRLRAFELGNELNTGGYNGDLAEPGSGRILGMADLNNPNDPEGRAVAAGYLTYLKILAVLKDARDHSQVNRTTPVIVGGMANVNLPSSQSYNKLLAVSLPGTIEFLRQNGVDNLVDGYGVHIYPNGDPRQSTSERIAKLESLIFPNCRQGTKPCWVTEWNINNSSKFCPLDETQRVKAMQLERAAFKHFVDQGRVVAIVWYTWNGSSFGQTETQDSVVRCGALTDAGKLALSPIPQN